MPPSMHFLAKAKNVGRIKAGTFARRLSHVLAINSDPPQFVMDTSKNRKKTSGFLTISSLKTCPDLRTALRLDAWDVPRGVFQSDSG